MKCLKFFLLLISTVFLIRPIWAGRTVLYFIHGTSRSKLSAKLRHRVNKDIHFPNLFESIYATLDRSLYNVKTIDGVASSYLKPPNKNLEINTYEETERYSDEPSNSWWERTFPRASSFFQKITGFGCTNRIQYIIKDINKISTNAEEANLALTVKRGEEKLKEKIASVDMSKKEDISKVIFIGHSRGAIIALSAANKLADKSPKIKVAAILIDPVRGPGLHIVKNLFGTPKYLTIHPRVKVLILAAQHETRSFFNLVMPISKSPTRNNKNVRVVLLPGHHSSMIGTKYSIDIKSKYGKLNQSEKDRMSDEFIENKRIAHSGDIYRYASAVLYNQLSAFGIDFSHTIKKEKNKKRKRGQFYNDEQQSLESLRMKWSAKDWNQKWDDVLNKKRNLWGRVSSRIKRYFSKKERKVSYLDENGKIKTVFYSEYFKEILENKVSKIKPLTW